MSGALEGVRVIDLTNTVLGPFATQLLGDAGADVIKVEPPAGDLVRYIGPHRTRGMGAYFLNLNRNKRSVVLDLKHAPARDALLRLIAGADVLVYNISGVEGAAARAGQRLTQAGWNVTVQPGTLELPEVTTTTVFFTEAPGERESATEVAKVLDNAPVELRRPQMADLPAGVIVTVTG